MLLAVLLISLLACAQSQLQGFLSQKNAAEQGRVVLTGKNIRKLLSSGAATIVSLDDSSSDSEKVIVSSKDSPSDTMRNSKAAELGGKIFTKEVVTERTIQGSDFPADSMIRGWNSRFFVNTRKPPVAKDAAKKLIPKTELYRNGATISSGSPVDLGSSFQKGNTESTSQSRVSVRKILLPGGTVKVFIPEKVLGSNTAGASFEKTSNFGNLLQKGSSGNTVSSGFGKRRFILIDNNAPDFSDIISGAGSGTKLVLKTPSEGNRRYKRVLLMQQ